MLRRIYMLLPLSFALCLSDCKSYEDSFNRDLDSTGVYVPNSGSNTVSQLAADPKSGILNDLGQLGAGNLPGYLTVNSTGTLAYLVNTNDNLVHVYSISKTTRKLTLTSTATTGTQPIMIAFHGSGRYAYVVNATSKTISAYSVDATSGALTSLGAAINMEGSGTRIPYYIAITGNYAVVTAAAHAELWLYDISSTTGAISVNGTPTATIGALPKWLTLVASGNNPKIFVATAANKIESMLFSDWPTPTTQVNTGANPMVFSFNPSNTMAFVSNYDAGSVSIYTISGITLTLTATVSTCTNPSQSLVNAAGFLYLICRADEKINGYSYTSSSLTSIGSATVGTTPASIAGY